MNCEEQTQILSEQNNNVLSLYPFIKDNFVTYVALSAYMQPLLQIQCIVIIVFHCDRDFANSKCNLNDININLSAGTRYMLKQLKVTC